MLPTPPPFTPQQRIANDFSQYPQAGMMAAALKGLADPSLYQKFGVQPFPTGAKVPYMDPQTGTYKGAQLASNVLPIPGMAGGTSPFQPTGLQIAHGENASKNPGTGILPFPLPGGPLGNERLQNIYIQNPPLRKSK